MANNPRHKENLKPFSKEYQPEKNGRPKKLPEIDALMAIVMGEDKDGITAAEAILKALRAKASKGDIRAAEVLLDRAYGKAKQTIDNNLQIKEKPIIDWINEIPTNEEAEGSTQSTQTE